MHTDCQSRGFTLTPALQAAVEAHAAEFRGRFPRFDISLQVRLSDVNGDRGGPDKCCLVRTRLHDRGLDLVASSTGDDLYLAIAGAFARLERATHAAVNRQKVRRRSLRLQRSAALVPAV